MKANLAARDEADRKARDTAARDALFAKRPDFSPVIRAALSNLPIVEIEKAVKDFPRVMVDSKSSAAALTPGANREDPKSLKQPSGSRLDDTERRVLANLRGANRRPDPSVTLKANLRGTTLTMPDYTPTREQAAARVKELRADLEALHNEEI